MTSKPWLFKKGHKVNLGRKLSKKTREKISLSKKGSVPWNKGLSGVYKTKPHSEATKRKIGLANVVALRGRKLSETTKSKVSISNSGENNPEWKGGITEENKRLRCLFQKTIAPSILRRDNYTCIICGRKKVELHIDHIKPWAKHPALRFKENNCRTVCQRCHYFITFGRSMPDDMKSWGRNLVSLKGGY